MVSVPDDSPFRPERSAWLWWPTGALRYRVHARLYAVATGLRLTLPDAMAPDWLGVSLLHWLGAAVLFFTGGALGWALCLLAVVLEVLFHSDQLTQSTYFGLVALSACLCFIGSKAGRAARLEQDLAAAVRTLTLGVYLLAGFHKINRDFLDPSVSCASLGLTALSEHYGVGAIERLSGASAWPAVFIAVELLLVALAVLRPAHAALFAVLMHVPLTVLFDSGFVFTMASGWVCLLTEAELRHLGRTLKRSWRLIIALAAPPAVFSLLIAPHDRWHTDPDWCVKEGVMWALVTWLGLAWLRRREAVGAAQATVSEVQGADGPEAARRHAAGDAYGWFGAFRELRRPQARYWAGLAAAAWFTLGATPYLGVNMQHAGAMLSNLRVDPGCYNHLLVPESVRLHDSTVKLTQITLRTPGAAPPAGATERVYNSETLPLAARRWCQLSPAGVRLEGERHGAPFTLEDVCAEGALPESPLPRLRRFQWNLEQQCPQRCIH